MKTVMLPATANAGVSSVGLSGRRVKGKVVRELDLTRGAGETLPLRQNQNTKGFEAKAVLLKFDTTPIEGWTVEKVASSIESAARHGAETEE